MTALVAYDEDTVLTASSDGMIRVLNIQPNKMVGVLGIHSDMDVEKLASSADKMFLASAGHDNTVKIWDLGQLVDDYDEEEDEEEEEREGQEAAEEPAAAAAVAASDSDSDSDAGAGKKRRKKRKKGEHRIVDKRQHAKQSSNFFDGLL